MLPKSYRLPSSDITRVIHKGRLVSGRNFQIILHKTNRPTSRFAVVISTRIDKRATKRNRAKRLIHESIQHLMPTITGGWDIIFRLTSILPSMKQPEVEQLVNNALIEAGVHYKL